MNDCLSFEEWEGIRGILRSEILKIECDLEEWGRAGKPYTDEKFWNERLLKTKCLLHKVESIQNTL